MQRFKNILCVVDTGRACKAVMERAVTLCENNQASLMVVDVVERVTAGIGMPDGGPISTDLQAVLVNTHEQGMETLVAPYRARVEIQTRVLVGVPFLEIILDVLRNGRDLVIKVPEYRDWLDRFFGSDDMHLLRKCPCSVWLIKPRRPRPYRRILAAVDVDEAYPPAELQSRRALNRQILVMASSLALSDNAELHVAHAWDALIESAVHAAFIHTPEDKLISYAEQERQHHAAALDALMREVAASPGEDALACLKPRTHLVKGWARKEIPALARRIEADIIVMGTVARTGVPGIIMGNTAETILNQINCSILAIKPPGFVTPVRLEN